MSLNLGNHWKGQFFTPYNVCRMMAEMNFGDGVQAEVERKGYISVCDPCVGAGAMLIAAANAMGRAKLNYQTNAVFVGQDIDRIVAMMAYIQISLIGCPGYIIIGNSLTNPPTGHVLFPQDTEGQEVWITPLFMHDIWEMRRTKELLLGLFGGTATTLKTVEKEHFYMFSISMKRRATMETKGFNGSEISEKNKEALQSEAWQEVRKIMKTEIQHFTEAPEIQHFATVKVSKNDNVYGVVWGNVVREYLKTAYSGENAQADVVSDGITYKVLKREEVTAFYDADGNTLFDVANGRLEKEYEYVMKEDKMTAVSEEEIDNAAEAEEKNADLEKKDADKETGETQEEKSEGKSESDVPTDDIEVPDPVSVKQMAKEKLEKEMKADKDKTFAEPVIGYLLKRCEDDLGLAQDVVQEHKTWKKCLDYIYGQARKQATENRAVVRNDVVYEWAEDYYHKDDKAEEEKKAKKEAERKAKQKKAAEERKAKAKENSAKAAPTPQKKEDMPKEQPKSKRNGKDMDGQLDMFFMMGM